VLFPVFTTYKHLNLKLSHNIWLFYFKIGGHPQAIPLLEKCERFTVALARIICLNQMMQPSAKVTLLHFVIIEFPEDNNHGTKPVSLVNFIILNLNIK
jgi:hypothetical protein